MSLFSKQDNQEKDSTKKVKKSKGRNHEYVVVMYLFLAIFVGIILYYIYFMAFQRDTFINNPYNSLQNLFGEHVVRGEITDCDGNVLAKTKVDENGQETRVYPYENLFAHVVGFSTNGKSGLENVENFELLRSHEFFLEQFADQMNDEKSQGDRVVTTLDLSIQQTAYNALGSCDGAVYVMEPQTGKILAMVSKPDFNPNTIEEDWESVSGEESTALFNRATQGQYAPGSVFKMVTLLEYYREHPLDYMNYSYQCEGGITVEDQTIHCAGNKAHGQEDLKQSFANSCNASFSNIGLQLDYQKYKALTDSLLFNKDLPIDFISSQSRFALKESDNDFMVMSTAMGQGKTLVSPLHMALLASAISNDGVLMRPYLVDHTENADGIVVRTQKPSQYGSIMSKEEADFLEEYMLEVVNTGTATALGRDGYDVAGKTGTAQVSDTSDTTNSWFVGYATKEDQRAVAVAVVVERNNENGVSAVNVAKQVLDSCF